MALITPIIQDEILTYQRGDSTAQVMVGSASWYAWLETASTFTFRSGQGHFTARKERAGNRRGALYWRAYRKRDGKLHRAYLGKSGELTLERLRAISAVLTDQGPLESSSQANLHEPGAAPLQILETPQNGQHSFSPTLATLSPHPHEPEQRQSSRRGLPTGTITSLFTDIEGSTHLLQQVGERYAHVLTECRHVLRTAFAQYNGYEVDTQGDAFFVVFARATDAVSAAVAAQRALASYCWPEDVMVRVRIGLHTGEPERAAEGYIGLDVHHAARIMSSGHGGQVLLSQTTRDLVEHDLPEGVTLRDLGEHHLKDLLRPSHLFQLVISDLPADFPKLQTLDTFSNNLPIPATTLIGREKELAVVVGLLRHEDMRLLTLTGPGGIGKTRLALQVAAELREDFANGVYFVPLAPVHNPKDVLVSIAQALGVWEAADLPLEEQVQNSLREKHVLLLLDNFEQILAAAPQLARLLTSCSQLHLLVTSRASLHLSGEQEFTLLPLVVPDLTQSSTHEDLERVASVHLFVERIRAIQPDFQLTRSNSRTIAEICARLDGLPLALELAAARIKLLPPQALLKRLYHRLEILTGGAQDLPNRQQTLRNTLQWSYDLLTEEEQRLFRWLSIFVGGHTLEAAEAVYQTDSKHASSVLEGVASLLDKSLVQQTEREDEEPRLVMLETIREFGLECLHRHGELEAARRAHARYYLEMAEAAEPHLLGSSQLMWFDRLEKELDNLRAILQVATTGGAEEVELALRLASALFYFWYGRSHLREGRSFLEQHLTRSHTIAASIRLKALVTLQAIMWAQNDAHGLGQIAQEALALAQGDQLNMTIAMNVRGVAMMLERRDYPEAQACLEEALASARVLGDRNLLFKALLNLGRLALFQRDASRAIAYLEEVLALYNAIGDKVIRAGALSLLARAELIQGNAVRARTLLEEGLTIFRKIGNNWGAALTLSLLGQSAFQQEEMSQAMAFLTEGSRLAHEVGDRRIIAHACLLQASVATLQGDYTEAHQRYEEGLTIAFSIEHAGFIASGLKGLGCVAAAQGLFTWAAVLWGKAESLRESHSVAIPRDLYERMVALVRTRLGRSNFDQIMADGHAMTAEQAFASHLTISPGEAQTSPTASTRSASYPSGLTKREVEVLRLVTQGLTDAQVAERLVISHRTVTTHLTSIYNKLGINSRAAAARFATEHRLV